VLIVFKSLFYQTVFMKDLLLTEKEEKQKSFPRPPGAPPDRKPIKEPDREKPLGDPLPPDKKKPRL
jgi:hypothetical protein